MRNRIVFMLVFLLSVFVLSGCNNTSTTEKKGEEVVESGSKLSQILDEGVIRVGTTGDYKPFTYLNPDMQEFEGSDIDAAKMLAEDLGVEVEFVQTTWPTLMEDLLDDKFDIAVGGITRTLERQKTAHLSKPYLDFGKAAIVRKEDNEKFKSIDDMNQPDVKVGVNPGGTNEEFVRVYLGDADITVVENNLEIPGKVAEGEFDVMITDSIEAILYSNEDDRLFPAFKEDTLTKSQMGYLMPQGEKELHDLVDLWIDEMKLNDIFKQLEEDWM